MVLLLQGISCSLLVGEKHVCEKGTEGPRCIDGRRILQKLDSVGECWVRERRRI